MYTKAEQTGVEKLTNSPLFRIPKTEQTAVEELNNASLFRIPKTEQTAVEKLTNAPEFRIFNAVKVEKQPRSKKALYFGLGLGITTAIVIGVALVNPALLFTLASWGPLAATSFATWSLPAITAVFAVVANLVVALTAGVGNLIAKMVSGKVRLEDKPKVKLKDESIVKNEDTSKVKQKDKTTINKLNSSVENKIQAAPTGSTEKLTIDRVACKNSSAKVICNELLKKKKRLYQAERYQADRYNFRIFSVVPDNADKLANKYIVEKRLCEEEAVEFENNDIIDIETMEVYAEVCKSKM